MTKLLGKYKKLTVYLKCIAKCLFIKVVQLFYICIYTHSYLLNDESHVIGATAPSSGQLSILHICNKQFLSFITVLINNINMWTPKKNLFLTCLAQPAVRPHPSTCGSGLHSPPAGPPAASWWPAASRHPHPGLDLPLQPSLSRSQNVAPLTLKPSRQLSFSNQMKPFCLEEGKKDGIYGTSNIHIIWTIIERSVNELQCCESPFRTDAIRSITSKQLSTVC